MPKSQTLSHQEPHPDRLLGSRTLLRARSIGHLRMIILRCPHADLKAQQVDQKSTELDRDRKNKNKKSLNRQIAK